MELDSYQQVDGGSDGQKWWKTSNKNGEMNHKSGTWMLVSSELRKPRDSYENGSSIAVKSVDECDQFNFSSFQFLGLTTLCIQAWSDRFIEDFMFQSRILHSTSSRFCVTVC